MPLRRVLAACLATAAVLSGADAPASAAKLRLVDARGDMWVSTDGGAPVPAPGSSLGDLTRAKVSYRGDKVRVRLSLVDIAKRGAYAQYALVLQGHGANPTREIVLDAAPGEWAGRVRVFKRHGDLVDDCAVTHDIDYVHNAVRLNVERSCLGRPGSVRANVNVYRATGAGTFYSDNPHDGLDHSDAWTAWVKRAH